MSTMRRRFELAFGKANVDRAEQRIINSLARFMVPRSLVQAMFATYTWQDPNPDFIPKTRLYATELDVIVNDLNYLRQQLLISIPTGVMWEYPPGPPAPGGWLICNWTEYANTEFPALATKLGTKYGGTVGSSFRVPDMRGRGPMGSGQLDGTGTNRVLGSKVGLETVILALTQVPGHSHTINEHVHGTGGQNTTHWHGLGGHWHGLEQHDHNIQHWHPAHIAAVRQSGSVNTAHTHWGFGGTVAEGSNVGGAGSSAPVNVESAANGAPNGLNRSGWVQNTQGAAGPSGGSDAADRDHNHGNTGGASDRGTNAQGGGLAHENTSPSTVTDFIIKT